jgi:preprotein translocase SecE subunit
MVGFYYRRATLAKKTTSKEEPSSKAKQVLRRRVNLTTSQALGRDVKMPRWLRAFLGYFSGSWRELRQVRWPNRRASWSLTTAVIAFTLVLVVFILALDYGFEQLFKKVIL